MRTRMYPWLLWPALLVHAHAAAADGIFTDAVDGRFDTSRWLLERKGFLLVPMVITEPAVGYGGGIGIAFFQKRPAGPPSIAGAMIAATENGTRAAGAGHFGVWFDDRLRTTTAAGAMSVNIDFYGGGGFPAFEQGIEYNLEGWGLFETVRYRLWKDRDAWIGVQLLHLDASIGLEQAPPLPIFDNLNGDVTNSAVGLVGTWDTRDNVLSPRTGWDAEGVVRHHWGEFGDDFTYTELDLESRYYRKLSSVWHLAWKLDTSLIDGDAPFYALPAVNLRGIAKGRYQGDTVVSTEVEGSYAIDSRWSAIAFAGVGRAAGSDQNLGSADDHWAGGVGFRYLIARLLGLQAGLDVARGPEEWAFYIQVGNAWSF